MKYVTTSRAAMTRPITTFFTTAFARSPAVFLAGGASVVDPSGGTAPGVSTGYEVAGGVVPGGVCPGGNAPDGVCPGPPGVGWPEGFAENGSLLMRRVYARSPPCPPG
ncbi:hypothetical protein GOTRE_001_00240 [Gordonia terrae NBRC 100016]|uniref:Uncharacterized protein n=1 Tax=Gordonia terrae NBRC 100016 TaxID=1089454 RepID=A0ABQ0H7B6_9ACTN|nr:hypothetical protein GOTRE_001_00240 [Gordonia terrae NBRC 100016]